MAVVGVNVGTSRTWRGICRKRYRKQPFVQGRVVGSGRALPQAVVVARKGVAGK